MKKRNFTKKVASLAMASAMILGLGVTAPNALAVEKEGHQAKLSKTFMRDQGTFTKGFTFSFKAEPGTKVDVSDTQKQPILPGVKEAIKLPTLSFSEYTTGAGVPTAKETKVGDITIDPSKFTAPGIYRYVIHEVGMLDGENKEDGITYPAKEKVRTLDVYIIKGANGFEVQGYQFINPATNKKTVEGNDDDGIFENKYVHDENNQGKLHNITVNKKVTGNMGDVNKDFTFKIKIVKADAGDVYTFEKGNTKEAIKADEFLRDTNKEKTITLKSGESFSIKGLSKNDKVEIVEEDFNKDGYTSKYELNGAVVGENKVTAVGDKDNAVVVTNEKNVDTPTGLFMQYAPYVLLLVGAGTIILIFRRKKDKEEA